MMENDPDLARSVRGIIDSVDMALLEVRGWVGGWERGGGGTLLERSVCFGGEASGGVEVPVNGHGLRLVRWRRGRWQKRSRTC